MSYFAAAVVKTEDGWTGSEVDVDELEDLEALTDHLRDLTGDGPGPALLLFEEDDEYVALVRVDGGAGGLSEPRVFLSDRRAVQNSDVAAMLWEAAEAPAPDDDDEGIRPLAEPVGEPDLLGDLGYSGDALVKLCGERGVLPADVLTEVCERIGCVDCLEALREG